MVKSANKSINELLKNLFNSIMNTETKAVITEEFKDMTENDMHILEAVGIEENNPRKVSDIAKKLDVTVGTLTTNMNNLEKKDYISRKRCKSDKRIVHVTLTERGKKAYFRHLDFHKRMIRRVVSEFTEEEQVILVRCLEKLEGFFYNYNDCI